jgi:hypothetical protein
VLLLFGPHQLQVSVSHLLWPVSHYLPRERSLSLLVHWLRGLVSTIQALTSSPHDTDSFFSFFRCRTIADVVLSQKLAEELQYEKTSSSNATEPEFLRSFKDQRIWQIEDIAGGDEVALTRTFGNENIRVVFSIADIQAQEQDPAYDDEDAGEDATSEEEPIHSYGVRVAFSVTKVCVLFLLVCRRSCVSDFSEYRQMALEP